MSCLTSRGRKSALLVLAILAWLGGGAAASAQTSQCVASAIAGGTADALTIPQLPCTPTTSLLILTFSQTNLTTSPTLQALGQGPAKPIIYSDGTAIGIGALGAGHTVPMAYNGTSWLILATPVAAGSGITQLTGDGTAGPGSGIQALTLATSGVAAGSYGDATHVPQCTYDAKGRATLCTNVLISASSGLTVGTSSITSGTNTRVLFDNAGILGEYTISGSGSVAMTNSPVFTTPNLGTPSSALLNNAVGLPISTGVNGLGTGVATALGVNVGTAGAVVVNGGVLGTPSSGTATNLTGLPISTGVSGLGAGVATFLATPNETNLTSIVSGVTYLDVSQSFTKGQAVTPTADGTQAAGGTLTVDLSLSNYHTATFGAGNLTIANPSNTKAGECGWLALKQDGVGSRTVSWGGNWKWAGGTAPTLTTTANASDLITFCAVSATVLAGQLSVANYQ